MKEPCRSSEAGIEGEYTVATLAKGYVQNVSCIKQYESLLQKQREYKKEAERLYVK